MPVAGGRRAARSWVSAGCCRSGRSRCRRSAPRTGRWPAARRSSRRARRGDRRPGRRGRGAVGSHQPASPKPGLPRVVLDHDGGAGGVQHRGQLPQPARAGGVGADEHVRVRGDLGGRPPGPRTGQPARDSGRGTVPARWPAPGSAAAQRAGECQGAADRSGRRAGRGRSGPRWPARPPPAPGRRLAVGGSGRARSGDDV